MILKTAKKKFELSNNPNIEIPISKIKKLRIYPKGKKYILEIKDKKYEFDFDFRKYYDLIDFLKKAKKDFTIGIDVNHVPPWFWDVDKDTIYEKWKKWEKYKEQMKKIIAKKQETKKKKRKIEKIQIDKDIFKNIRKENKLTIDEFAKKIGVKSKKVLKVEMGLDYYTRKQIEKIEKIFKKKILK